jgi:hypothetical protein
VDWFNLKNITSFYIWVSASNLNLFILALSLIFIPSLMAIIDEVNLYCSTKGQFIRYSFYNILLSIVVFFGFDFSTSIGIFVSIETTLWFSCNVDKILTFQQFYRHCISVLGADNLYDIPELNLGLNQTDDNVFCVFGSPSKYGNTSCVFKLKEILKTVFDSGGFINRVKLLDVEYLISEIKKEIDCIIVEHNWKCLWSKEYEIKTADDLQNLFNRNHRRLTKKEGFQ